MENRNAQGFINSAEGTGKSYIKGRASEAQDRFLSEEAAPLNIEKQTHTKVVILAY